jgi:RNA polymerase sigma factor (sigma-70 family)
MVTLSWFEPSELADVVEQLPFRQRVVIVGRYWGGWSEAEIAAALGCRPGTVKSLASRALATLRLELKELEA